jgi:hypothetical protein
MIMKTSVQLSNANNPAGSGVVGSASLSDGFTRVRLTRFILRSSFDVVFKKRLLLSAGPCAKTEHYMRIGCLPFFVDRIMHSLVVEH